MQKNGTIHIGVISILDHTYIQTYNLANNESQYTEGTSARFEAATILEYPPFIKWQVALHICSSSLQEFGDCIESRKPNIMPDVQIILKDLAESFQRCWLAFGETIKPKICT